MSNVQIRATTEADAEAFRDLRLRGLRDHPEAYGADADEMAGRTLQEWREMMRNGAVNNSGALFVAEVEGALVGITRVVRDSEGRKVRHTADIFSVYVRPDMRGQGIADALLHASEDWARTQGIHQIKLSVTTVNTAAIRCYVRNGFQVYGVDPDVIAWNGQFYSELLMVKRLGEHR